MKHVLILFISVISFSGLCYCQQHNEPNQHSSPADRSVLVYSKGASSTGFWLDVPSGWVIDQEVGKAHGICCVFYPKESTWNNAETVIYPRVTTKESGLKEFMDRDLAEFREHNPEMKHEDAKDIALRDKRIAKLRFLHGVNHGSSEAVAYIEEEKIIAVVVASSRSKNGFEESLPIFRKLLETYSCCMTVNDQVTGTPAAKP